MIARYSNPVLEKIWSDENRFSNWLKVERALLQALEEKSLIPKGIKDAFQSVTIRPERIREIEKVTQHDVIAFCSSITEQVEPKFARFFHYGVTSSDIIDTALSLQLSDSILEVEIRLKTVLQALSRLTDQHSYLLGMGRSHGMFAEPMIYAQKWLGFYAEFKRRLEDYQRHRLGLTGQCSGAVGNYTVLTPEIEQRVCDLLGLQVETVSTQVIPRDRILTLIQTGAALAIAIERLSVEMRHLQHSDLAEISEGFSQGQKGSSAMPHKKNPITFENLSGLSRVIKSHAGIALENSVLWHERDISHSSAERIMLPDHFGLLSYMLERLARELNQLVVFEKNIESKVDQAPACLSSYVLHRLIDQNEVLREDLYEAVQKVAFDSKSTEDFLAKIKAVASDRGWSFCPNDFDLSQLKQRYHESFMLIKSRTI